MEKSFAFPDLTDKKVLVLGLGGGCDCLVAYAFAHDVVKPRTNCKLLFYGNTIGLRSFRGHPQIAPYIYSVPPGPPTPVVPGDSCVGTTKLECSLPRGEGEGNSSPLLFVVPLNRGDVNETFQFNKNALLSDIAKMEFDFIFGVDTGGDSLTGGIDWHDHPALGRDRQILAILSWLPNVAFLHCMFAPCSDGESSYELMCSSIETAIEHSHYCGQFSSIPMMDTLRQISSAMGPSRTPQVMLHAYDKKLHRTTPTTTNTATTTTTTTTTNTDTNNTSISSSTFVIVERGINPVVPEEWLTTCFVFSWPKEMLPDYLLSY